MLGDATRRDDDDDVTAGGYKFDLEVIIHNKIQKNKRNYSDISCWLSSVLET